MEYMTESETEKLESIAAECYNKGVKAADNDDFFMAIGCFQTAWALGRYTENIPLMNFSSDSLLRLGLSPKTVRACQEDGYKIIGNDYVIGCLLRNVAPNIM